MVHVEFQMQEKHRSVIYKAMPLIIADLIVDYTFLAKFLQDGIFIEESIEAILVSLNMRLILHSILGVNTNGYCFLDAQ